MHFACSFRYVAVCHPLRVKQWKKWNVVCISATIYIVALIRSALPPLYDNVYKVKWNADTKSVNYICNGDIASVFSTWFHAIGIGLFYVLVFAVIIFFSTKIICALRSSRHLTKNNVKAEKSREKVARIVLVMCVAFAVSWSLLNSIVLMYTTPALNHIMTTQWFTVYLFIARILEYSNCVFNPLMYAALSSNFKKACRVVFYDPIRKRHGATTRDKSASDTTLFSVTSVSFRHTSA